jgi:hypothetical protein
MGLFTVGKESVYKALQDKTSYAGKVLVAPTGFEPVLED